MPGIIKKKEAGDSSEIIGKEINEVEHKQPSIEAPKIAEVQESSGESPLESLQEEQHSQPEISSVETTAPKPIQQATQTPSKDKITQEIEELMSEDLTEMFLQMTPQEQEEFKIKGEQTASTIRELVTKTKLNTKKIFHLIKSWLKLIPGVNRFFLEQEAKIKTDKISILAEEEKRKGNINN
ncbi:MAG: hypothetical protein ABIH21_03035 [Patescibacteria group bacterium]